MTAREILEKLVQSQELRKYPHSYNPIIIDLALTELKKMLMDSLPASNRKSCLASDHYFGRFKEGWNRNRHETREAIASLFEVKG